MTTPFTQLTAVAAPLSIANIDTDMIIPAHFLKTVTRKGLRNGLFYAARFDDAGQERSDFVLNQLPWRNAGILVTLGNFGCGSSREHAPWALLDYGIHSVIAPGFADIFYNNCFKNAMLPIVLPQPEVEQLLQTVSQAETASLHIDLEQQTVTSSAGSLHFQIDAQRKYCLLLGIDEIARSLEREQDIAQYEKLIAAEHWRAPPIHL